MKIINNIFIFIFLFVIIFNSVSAVNLATDYWPTYGSSYGVIDNTGVSNSNGYLNLGVNVTTYPFTSSINSGVRSDININFNQQLTTFTGNGATAQYLVAVNNGALTVYDSNFVALASITSGNQTKTLNLLGYYTNRLEILGLFTNATSTYFNVYYFDTVSNTLSLNSTVEVVGTDVGSIRCMNAQGIGGDIVGSYTGNLVCAGFSALNTTAYNLNTYFDNGTIRTVQVVGVTGGAIRPEYISFNPSLTDNLPFVAYSTNKLYYMYLNGTIKFSRTATTGYAYTDAGFFYNETGSGRHIYYTETKIATTRDFRLAPLSLEGSPVFLGSAITIATQAGDSLFTGGSSVGYYNMGDASQNLAQQIAVSYSNATSTVVKVYSMYDNVLLKEYSIDRQILSVDTNGRYVGQGSLIAAKLNGDDYYDFIVNSVKSNVNATVADVYNNAEIYTGKGNFIVSDIKGKRANEIVGFNSTALIYIGNAYTPPNENNASIPITNSNITNPALVAITNTFIGLFPDASTLSHTQRIAIALVVMLLSVVFILFIGSKLGDGMHVLLLWITLIVLGVEFMYFVAISYISFWVLLLIILTIIGVGYLFVRGRN